MPAGFVGHHVDDGDGATAEAAFEAVVGWQGDLYLAAGCEIDLDEREVVEHVLGQRRARATLHVLADIRRRARRLGRPGPVGC
jgi:hypothetical protein